MLNIVVLAEVVQKKKGFIISVASTTNCTGAQCTAAAIEEVLEQFAVIFLHTAHYQ